MEIEPVTREEMYLAKAAGQNVKTPEPITRKEMFLDAVARNGGSGGVTSWNNLTDKPFGDMVEVYPETAFSYVESLGFFVSPDAFPSSLIAGYNYVIRYNGVDYPCTAFDAVFSNMAIVAVGNTSATGGENNGLPFVVAYMDGALGTLPLDGSTSVIVGIKAPKKLHPQYVPTQAQYVYETNIMAFSKDADSYSCFEPELPLALLEAIYQRTPICMKMLDKNDDGTLNGVEYFGLASVGCHYEHVALGLGLADKTSEIFKIPEGTVVNGTEVTTQQLLGEMGVRITTRMPYFINECDDFIVWFIDPESLG